MPSLRQNFIYNAILTMSGYIFPLMVYPYVSRILGVSNIGACNFVDSIVEYFTIISMMGMNTIGIREIAKCKRDIVYFAEHYYRVINLDKGLHIIKLYDVQKEFLKFLVENNKIICCSGR